MNKDCHRWRLKFWHKSARTLKIVSGVFLTIALTVSAYVATSWAAAGDFAIYRETIGLENIPVGSTDLAWDTNVSTSGTITKQVGNIDFAANETGHYLMMYSVPTASSSGSNRSEIQSWIRLNNTTNLAYGRGQAYIRRANSNFEGYNQGAAILDLNATDTVRVQMGRTDSNSATVQRRANKAGVMFLKLDDTWNYLRSRPSSNQSFDTTTFTDVNWGIDDELDAGGFSRTGADITLQEAGHYLVTFNIDATHSSGWVRVNDEARLVLDGTEIDGTRVTTYMRGSNGTNDGVMSYVGIIETTSPNQILKVQVRRDSSFNTTGHSIVAADSGITIAKLPDTADYVRLGEIGGGQDLSTTRTNITWDENLEVDATSFAHSNVTNPERIDIQQDGDYLFLHSVYNARTDSSNGPREASFLEWQIAGGTPYPYGSSGSYNRASNDGSGITNSSGSAGGIIADGLTSAQAIVLTQINEATNNTASYQADRMAIQGVNIASLFSASSAINQIHFRWRDDSTALNTSGGFAAAEDANLPSALDRGTVRRLRIAVANEGSLDDAIARSYELQFGDKTNLSSCSNVAAWTGVSDASNDAFTLVDTTHINPDGQATTSGLLTNSEGYTFVNGQGRDIVDTTNSIGPLAINNYSEFEFAVQIAEEAITGHSYCFRLFDQLNGLPLATYSVYPELTIDSTAVPKTIGQYGTQALTDNTWTTVNLSNSYQNLVVVASPRYGPTTDFYRSVRIRNKTATSFQIKVDDYFSFFFGPTTVDWLAMEAGNHNISNGTSQTKVVAGTQNTGVVLCNGAYGTTGTPVNFGTTFNSPPAVIHTLASDTDTTWGYSVVNGGTQQSEPSTTGMNVAIGRSFDTCTHGAEDIDYIAFDIGHGTNNGGEFEALRSADSIACCSTTGYPTNYATTFSSTPAVTLVAQLGEDGGNGGTASIHTGSTSTASTVFTSIDEDGPGADRSHTTEVVALLAFQNATGTLTAQPTYLDQTHFRWYQNLNNITPSTPLAAENGVAGGVENGDAIRLRLSLQNGVSALPATSQTLKLQFQQAAACSPAGAWTDVGAAGSAVAWRGFDNAGVTDGDTLPSSLLNSGLNTLQSYVEQNNSPANPNSVAIGNRTEYDWVLEYNDSLTGVGYCFRVVTADNAPIHYYRYPNVIVGDDAQFIFQF